MAHTRLWRLALQFAALGLPLLLLGAGLARSEALTLDGRRDAAYVLLATDPANDLAAGLVSNPNTYWAELSELYVTTDTTNLYVYVALPNYSHVNAIGEIGLAIDTTGDVAGSGGATDPRTSALTYAYTVTHANSGIVPVNTSYIILPDVLIRGSVAGAEVNDNGFTALMHWSGSAWTGAGTNWGGIAFGNQEGTNVAYDDGYGVEFFIPYADLGVPPEAPLHLQFFTTPHTVLVNSGAFDTVPADDQVTAIGEATVQRRLASLVPVAPPELCDPAGLADSAVVAAELRHDSTNLGDRDPLGGLLPGATATLRLRACAGDLQGVDLLVWDTADPQAGSPTQILALSPTFAAGYAFWTGPVSAPASGGDQWYQFRLTDAGPVGYFRPQSGTSGPGQWSASLAAPAWHLPTLPGLALFVPLVIRP